MKISKLAIETIHRASSLTTNDGILMSVHVVVGKNVTIESCNGHALVRTVLPKEEIEIPEGRYYFKILPVGMKSELKKIEKQYLNIECVNKNYVVLCGAIGIPFHEADIEYHNLNLVIPKLMENEYEISLNPKLLLKIAEAIKLDAYRSDGIVLKIKNGRAAVIVEDFKNKESIGVIMPIKLDKACGAWYRKDENEVR